MYALTASALQVFDVKQKSSGWKIKSHVATFPRSDFSVSLTRGKVTNQITFRFTDGNEITLESVSAATFNDDLLATLVAQQSAPSA
jgi:hypothetical protein